MDYIGIDPGLSGAIAIIKENGEYIEVYDMPIVDKKVDFDALVGILRLHPNAHAMVELQNPFPGEGVVSVFKMGMGYSTILNALSTVCIPTQIVSPQVWKKQLSLIKKDKEASRARAMMLFPLAELSRKKDHGRAEALLIASHGHRWWSRAD